MCLWHTYAVRVVLCERLQAVLPKYAHGYEEDAGCDLFAIEGHSVKYGEVAMVRTGIKLAMPPGVQAEIRSKSGLATRGVHVVNSPGTVDPSYRGELVVILTNVLQDTVHYINPGDKVAQIVFTEYLGAELIEGTLENDTQRGTGGFGSTGN